MGSFGGKPARPSQTFSPSSPTSSPCPTAPTHPQMSAEKAVEMLAPPLNSKESIYLVSLIELTANLLGEEAGRCGGGPATALAR